MQTRKKVTGAIRENCSRRVSRTLMAALFVLLFSTVQAWAQQASITLACNGELCNTNNTEWTLTKTSQVSSPAPSGSTITWTVTATKGSTGPNTITVNGFVTITNSGTATGQIGNIVVNLQKPAAKNPQKASWVSV